MSLQSQPRLLLAEKDNTYGGDVQQEDLPFLLHKEAQV